MTRPFRIDEPGFVGALLAGLLLGQHVWKQGDGLDVAAAPASLRYGDHFAASVFSRILGPADRARGEDHSTVRVLREGMVPRRRAARDLHVHDAVADPVAAQDFAGHEPERVAWNRHVHPELAERALQAVQVRLLVDHSTAEDGGDFVDPVRELVSPVLDMDVSQGRVACSCR